MLLPVSIKNTYSLKKLFTSFLGFKAFTFCWLFCFFPEDTESSNFSLLGIENDLEAFLRSLCEERGVWELRVDLHFSLIPPSESTLVSRLSKLCAIFLEVLAFPSSSFDSDEISIWGRLLLRHFVEETVGGRISSSSLDPVILMIPWFHRNKAQYLDDETSLANKNALNDSNKFSRILRQYFNERFLHKIALTLLQSFDHSRISLRGILHYQGAFHAFSKSKKTLKPNTKQLIDANKELNLPGQRNDCFSRFLSSARFSFSRTQ